MGLAVVVVRTNRITYGMFDKSLRLSVKWLLNSALTAPNKNAE